jgi:hypothetical protein
MDTLSARLSLPHPALAAIPLSPSTPTPQALLLHLPTLKSLLPQLPPPLLLESQSFTPLIFKGLFLILGCSNAGLPGKEAWRTKGASTLKMVVEVGEGGEGRVVVVGGGVRGGEGVERGEMWVGRVVWMSGRVVMGVGLA